jgi:hypothetical protein
MPILSRRRNEVDHLPVERTSRLVEVWGKRREQGASLAQHQFSTNKIDDLLGREPPCTNGISLAQTGLLMYNIHSEVAENPDV